jgi:hypothetical protein
MEAGNDVEILCKRQMGILGAGVRLALIFASDWRKLL